MKHNRAENLIKMCFLTGFLLCVPKERIVKANEPNDPNQSEKPDVIVCTAFYGWWNNPNYGEGWWHWSGTGYSPPKTWTANYIPNYPTSNWNPQVQLYSSLDPEVLRWQDKLMARAGIDIAIGDWWGINDLANAYLKEAIHICKSVQWCIYYEPEGYGNPSPQQIYNDIKYVIDNYGPSRNYAKIDGKWLVFVYIHDSTRVDSQNTADRWAEAKRMLGEDGYPVYLNGDVRVIPENHPWDALHRYFPRVYFGVGVAQSGFDNSAWISPGFWLYGSQKPRLERSLSKFAEAVKSIPEISSSIRWLIIETWNEWHEGTQIEPGQEIVPDTSGYYPSGKDYGYDFIDALSHTTTFDLQWTSSGHRPVVPVRLEAEEMIWDDDSKIRLSEEDPNEVLIAEKGIRIGSSIFVPETQDSNGVIFNVRATSLATKAARLPLYPKMGLYLDDEIAWEGEVIGSIPQFGIESNYQDYRVVLPVEKGIHKIELAMTQEPQGWSWDLIVDFIDVNATFAEDPNKTDPQREGP